MTKYRITASTMRKLQAIERHQRAVKRLVAEVEQSYGVEDVEDDVSRWTWGMNVDQQGRVYSAEQLAELLAEFLKRKSP